MVEAAPRAEEVVLTPDSGSENLGDAEAKELAEEAKHGLDSGYGTN